MKKLYKTLLPYEKEGVDFGLFCERLKSNRIVVLKGRSRSVCVGEGLSVKVNSSIGLNSESAYDGEINKIKTIKTTAIKPDIMMDLSTISVKNPLYKSIITELGCPVGTIPYYSCFSEKTGLDKTELLCTIEEQLSGGLAFMTLHFTADSGLFRIAQSRSVPVISRGGSVLLRDMRINRREKNILYELRDDIVRLCKKYGAAISVGTVFRPSTQRDALDEVHIMELNAQRQIAKDLINDGVSVIQEGVGHIPMHRIAEYVKELRRDIYVPFMPLGPIVSDRTRGFDHICSSVGAGYMAFLGGADIINAVTREEHTGGIPSIASIAEAIEAAKTTSAIIDDTRFYSYFAREAGRNTCNCMGEDDRTGCSRCGRECPYIDNIFVKNL